MKALIGRKVGMTQIFGENGVAEAVTLIKGGPCVVTQVRGVEPDGYQAIQLGYEEAKRVSKAKAGHLKPSQSRARVLREFRVASKAADEAAAGLKVGDKLDVDQFEIGDVVAIKGISKGHGFSGTIKRFNFKRGPKTHGSKSYRAPGSIGSMYPQKVWKGKKMAGRHGKNTVTLRKVEVVGVAADDHLLALKGPIPGPNRSLVLIKG